MVTLSTQTLLILNTETNCCDDAPSEQEENQIRKDDTMPKTVVRRIFLTVDVAADDTVQVSPSLTDCQLDTLGKEK